MVLLNIQLSVPWLHKDMVKRGNAGSSNLSTSCYARGTCQVYTAGLRARGIMWDKAHDPLRVLCNGVLENWGLRDMARVADQLYEVMEAVIENPELMLDSEYAVFPTDKFPVLSASLEAKQSRTRQSLDKGAYGSQIRACGSPLGTATAALLPFSRTPTYNI